jgi:hypothetical protein
VSRVVKTRLIDWFEAASENSSNPAEDMAVLELIDFVVGTWIIVVETPTVVAELNSVAVMIIDTAFAEMLVAVEFVAQFPAGLRWDFDMKVVELVELPVEEAVGMMVEWLVEELGTMVEGAVGEVVGI